MVPGRRSGQRADRPRGTTRIRISHATLQHARSGRRVGLHAPRTRRPWWRPAPTTASSRPRTELHTTTSSYPSSCPASTRQTRWPPAFARRTSIEAGIAGEVVVADNGSTDGLAGDRAREAARGRVGRGPRLRRRTDGRHRAARGRFVIMGDADDSYDFRELPRFVERLREGATWSRDAASPRWRRSCPARCRSCIAGSATRCSRGWSAHGSGAHPRRLLRLRGFTRALRTSGSTCAAPGWSSRRR